MEDKPRPHLRNQTYREKNINAYAVGIVTTFFVPKDAKPQDSNPEPFLLQGSIANRCSAVPPRLAT